MGRASGLKPLTPQCGALVWLRGKAKACFSNNMSRNPSDPCAVSEHVHRGRPAGSAQVWVTPVSYWLFTLLCVLAFLILEGQADHSIFIVMLLLVAPLFLLNIALLFLRSIFSRSAAMGLGPIVAAVAAFAVLAAYYYSGAI